MERKCVVCEKLFRDGDRIEVLIQGTYLAYKTSVGASIASNDMTAIAGTVVHVACADDEDLNGPLGRIGFNN